MMISMMLPMADERLLKLWHNNNDNIIIMMMMDNPIEYNHRMGSEITTNLAPTLIDSD
jgi:hypothetical protein